MEGRIESETGPVSVPNFQIGNEGNGDAVETEKGGKKKEEKKERKKEKEEEEDGLFFFLPSRYILAVLVIPQTGHDE